MWSVRGVCVPCSARIWTGWLRNVRARLTIGPGMVAENSIVWRCAGTQLHQPLDVGQEAEVEHLVGLVQDQDLYRAEDEVALLGEVEQATGRADDDVDAAAQRLDLRLVGPAAVDRHDPRADLGPGRGEVARDLDGELAGRRDHERLGGVPRAADGRVIRLSSGTPKPRVLPVPVRAWPIRSLPASAIGRVSSWMAKVRMMPASAERGDDLGADVEVAERRALREHRRRGDAVERVRRRGSASAVWSASEGGFELSVMWNPRRQVRRPTTRPQCPKAAMSAYDP